MKEDLIRRLEKERQARIEAEKRNKKLERENTYLKTELSRTISDREYICA